MKYLFAVCALFIVNIASAKEVVHRDRLGMPRCIESKESVLIVWDPLIKKSARPVFGISLRDYAKANNHFLRSCSDWPSAVKWPEGISLIADFENDFSDSARFAIRQISEGGRVFRAEASGSEFVSLRQNQFQAQRPVDFGKMESDFGSIFTNEVVNTWIQRLQSSRKLNAHKCDQLIGTCDYYLCLEATHQCGVQGYPVGYGYKYCNRSLHGLQQKMKSQKGREWVTKTVQCLQTKIQAELKNENLSCSQIERRALDSHPECYVGSGFCGMPMDDKLKVFETVKDQLLKTDTLSQGAATLRLCGESHE